MVLGQEVARLRALWARPQVVWQVLLTPRWENEASKFRAKWHGQQTRGLEGEPMGLFARKQSKPPHKRQGFGQ